MALEISSFLRKVTFWLLCGFVFSLAWEPFVTVESIGTVSRLIGMLALGFGFLTIAAHGRIRRPSPVVYFAFAFILANVLSLVWTISFDESMPRVRTYIQLFALVWIIWEIVRTAEKAESLMLAYCLGAYVSIADALQRFASGRDFGGVQRFTGGNLNPNEFGAYLALGIPIAWFLFLKRRGIVRIVVAAYLPLATLALLLTASRNAFLAGVVALSVVPLTASRRSLRSWAVAVIVLLLGIGLAAVVVPEATWNRIVSTQAEISAGTFGGRGIIWAAGLEVFQDRPLLGFGSGAFENAVEPLLGPRGEAPHNVFLAVAVEQGLIGLSIFIAMLCASVRLIVGLAPPLRNVWAVTMLIWLIGSMSINWQYGKVTWLLFALLAVHSTTQKALPADAYSHDSEVPSQRRSFAYVRKDVA